jgi:MFS family permease
MAADPSYAIAMPATGADGPRANEGVRRGTGAAFRHLNFRLFWTGQLVSLGGTWMQTLAQGWLILQLTNDDAFALGIVLAAQFLPVLVFGLFGGVVADAVPKRGTIIATQVASMALALALGILTVAGAVEVWHIIVLAFLLGCVNAVDMPTRQAFVIEMVGREDVANAVALNSAAFNAARIVGPAIAGIIIGAFGVSTCFFLNGISYVAVIAGLLAMHVDQIDARGGHRFGRSAGAVVENLAEGLVYVRRTPVVLLAVVLVGVVSTFGMNFNVLVPVFAKDVLHVGASGFGFLMAAGGLGSLASALGLAYAGRTSARIVVAGAATLGVLEVALGIVHIFPLALALMLGAGFGSIAMTASANTVIQLNVPDELRGRVLSVYTTVFVGSTPVGGIVAGALAARFGASAAFVVGGGLSLAAAAVAAAVAGQALGRSVPVVPPAKAVGGARVRGGPGPAAGDMIADRAPKAAKR